MTYAAAEADFPEEIDHDVLWTAVGERDWVRVEQLLQDSGYELDDLGALAAEDRDRGA